MTTVTPRLDLDGNVVQAAKKAMARRRGLDPETVDLQSIAFSDTAEAALQQFGEHIVQCLENAGLRRQENVERGRPRRVREELWNQLAGIAKEFDTSRVSVLRAALALLGNEAGGGTTGRTPRSA